jgi:hypothetical protein
LEDNLGKQERWSFRCQNEVMCGGQEIWSKVEYNRMIRNRVEHIGKIKDIAKCRSGGSRDWSHVVDLPTIKPNIEAYAPRNSESGSYVVVRWRHTVNLKQTKLKQTLGVSLCQLRHGREKT